MCARQQFYLSSSVAASSQIEMADADYNSAEDSDYVPEGGSDDDEPLPHGGDLEDDLDE